MADVSRRSTKYGTRVEHCGISQTARLALAADGARVELFERVFVQDLNDAGHIVRAALEHDPFDDSLGDGADVVDTIFLEGCPGQCRGLLEGTRRAGSYKQWVLQGRGPYKKLLRLRSQVARGYATIGRGTPPVVARLFGLPGVPDPCFWLVVEYAWLGDWRRP